MTCLLYLAHPVGAPTQAGIDANIARALRWVRWLVVNTEHAICAPWIAYVQATQGQFRERGLADDLLMLARCDAMIMVGERVSEGMRAEMEYARKLGMPVVDLTTDRWSEPPRINTAFEGYAQQQIREFIDAAPCRMPVGIRG